MTEEAQSAIPVAAEHPTPDAAEHPTPDAAEHPTPDAPEHPAPDAAEHPTPDAAEFPAPDAAEFPVPDAAEFPAPDASDPARATTATPEPGAMVARADYAHHQKCQFCGRPARWLSSKITRRRLRPWTHLRAHQSRAGPDP